MLFGRLSSPRAALLCLVVLCAVGRSDAAARAKKASRAMLDKVKSLINEDASRQISAKQQDSVDVFADLRRDPKAKPHKDELSVNNPEEYFQGDVDLSEHQVNQIILENSKGLTGNARRKRKVGRAPLYKQWDRLKPISFDFAETIPVETRHKIRGAMRLWQRSTCIRFEENGPDVDRIEFFDGGGCSSFVGRIGGTQGISIATPGCDVVGIISHEIGHCLGIFHEQARPDQESHISVNYNNIPLNRWNNFQPVGDDQADTFNLPYDTGSVMHYGPYGFAADPYLPTIRTLDRTQQSTIGQRITPSFLDFQAINILYGCTKHCPPLACLHNGYANPNNCSSCICPDGYTGPTCDLLLPSNDLCGGILFAETGIQFVSSPNYPSAFQTGVECYWNIIAPSEGRVFLQFEQEVFDFLCEDTCDKSYVEIKYHNDKRRTGGRYCCSSPPTQKFVSFDNEMLVILRGHGGAGNGFRARFWSDKNFEVQTTTQTNSIISLPGLMVNHRNLKETFPLELTTPATTTPANATVNIKPKQPPALVHTKPAVVVSIRPVLPSSTLAPIVPIVPVTTWQTITTPQPTAATTTDSDILNSGVECGCGPWSEWIGECTQQCGGCGSRTRTRTCQKEPCRKTEKRSCNFKVCPEGTNFLINNGEFHILWRGCCVGLFKSGTECTALETNQNPFFKIINSLLNVNDSKYNRTILSRMRGEH